MKQENYISICNGKYHPYLEAGIFKVGQFLDINKEKVIQDDLLFKLEKAIPPIPEIGQELDENARRIKKKLKNLKQTMPVHKEKLNFLMTKSKEKVSKLYKLVMRRQFFITNHISFDNRWILVLKQGGKIRNYNRIREEFNKLGINSETQRAGLRNCIGSKTPSEIKKPSYELCMAAVRTDIHIVKFKSHLTGVIRNCLKCDDEINNTIHTFFHCQVATFILDLV